MPGEDRPTTAQRQSAAKKTAEQYLSQGFYWLTKVGESTAAAIFVTLGPSEFTLTPEGKLYFGGVERELRELKEDVDDVPYGWSVVQEYLKFGPRLQPIIQQAIDVSAKEFLVRVAFIASRIMPKKEKKDE